MTTEQILNEYVSMAAGENYTLFYNRHAYRGRLMYEVWNDTACVSAHATEAEARAMFTRLEG